MEQGELKRWMARLGDLSSQGFVVLVEGKIERDFFRNLFQEPVAVECPPATTGDLEPKHLITSVVTSGSFTNLIGIVAPYVELRAIQCRFVSIHSCF